MWYYIHVRSSHLSRVKLSHCRKMKLLSGCVAPSAGQFADDSRWPDFHECACADFSQIGGQQSRMKDGRLSCGVWQCCYLWSTARRQTICCQLDAEHVITIVAAICGSDHAADSKFREWLMVAFIACVIKPWQAIDINRSKLIVVQSGSSRTCVVTTTSDTQWRRTTKNINPELFIYSTFKDCFHKLVNELQMGTKEPQVMMMKLPILPCAEKLES